VLRRAHNAEVLHAPVDKTQTDPSCVDNLPRYVTGCRRGLHMPGISYCDCLMPGCWQDGPKGSACRSARSPSVWRICTNAEYEKRWCDAATS
jgi:hypothetical protein